MSNSTAPNHSANSPLRNGWLTARRTSRAAAFWAAVTLPFLYLPLLVVGPQSIAEWLTVGMLVVVHAVALVVGHTHHQ
jgi:hypothetical protein